MIIFIEDRYIRDKPNPDHWEGLIDNDNDFREEFECIYNNDKIPDAGDEDYTPYVLDNTYFNMGVTLSRDGKGPELARFVKRLREKYFTPILKSNDNPILYSLIYEVDYPDEH